MSRTSSKRPLSTAPSATSHTFVPSPLDALLAQNGLTRYHLEPPSWRAPWLPSPLPPTTAQATKNQDKRTPVEEKGGELHAWPQFYPTCDGQEEDQLTEQAVKAGFAGRTVVQVRCRLVSLSLKASPMARYKRVEQRTRIEELQN